MTTLISKGWPYLVVVALGVTIYFWGSSNGQDKIQAKWDAQKAEDQKAYNKLKGEYDDGFPLHLPEAYWWNCGDRGIK